MVSRDISPHHVRHSLQVSFGLDGHPSLRDLLAHTGFVKRVQWNFDADLCSRLRCAGDSLSALGKQKDTKRAAQ